MTKDLQPLVAYLCANYPTKSDLSKPRLTKMVYLADWLAAVRYGEPLTDIEWIYNHYGPFVFDVIDLVKNRRDEFEVKPHGSRWESVTFRGSNVNITEEQKRVLDEVIRRTHGMAWPDFIATIYGTYPVRSQPKYSKLDLKELASKYKQQRAELAATRSQTPGG